MESPNVRKKIVTRTTWIVNHLVLKSMFHILREVQSKKCLILDPFNTHLASKIQRNKSQLGSGRDGESRVYTLQLLAFKNPAAATRARKGQKLCGLLQVLKKFSTKTPAQHKQEF
jgi:hypothetical protein